MGNLTQSEIIIILLIVLLVLIVYLVIKYGKTTNSSDNDDDWNEEDESEDKTTKKTDEFYDDLSFMFPVLDSIDEPLELSTVLLKNTDITEAQLKKEFEKIANVKDEDGHLSFDIDGTHIDLNKASREIVVDNSVHIVSNSSGLLFTAEDKALKVGMHQEKGEYVVDEYATIDPEGISSELETRAEENSTAEVFENDNASNTDDMILESDTSY